MQCEKCGVDLAEGAVFCHRCGHRTDGQEQAYHEPTPPASADAPAGAAEGLTARERFREAAAAKKELSISTPEDTTILWKGRYSPAAMAGNWVLCGLATLILLVGGIWALFNDWGWWVFGVALVGSLALWAWFGGVFLYRRWSYGYEFTAHRFTHYEGLLTRSTDRIELIDISDITYRQGLVERMFGVGTIRITSSDKSHPQLDLPGIADVARTANLLDNTRREERRRRSLFVESV